MDISTCHWWCPGRPDEYAHCGNNFFLPDRGAWLALLSNRLTGNSAVGKDVVRHPSSAYGGRGEKFDADRVARAAVRGERFAPSRGRAIAAKVTPAERSVGVERVAAIRRQLASVRVADARHCWRRQDGLRREGAARSVAARRSVAGVREGRRKGLAAAFLLRRAARRACARGGARHGLRVLFVDSVLEIPEDIAQKSTAVSVKTAPSSLARRRWYPGESAHPAGSRSRHDGQ